MSRWFRSPVRRRIMQNLRKQISGKPDATTDLALRSRMAGHAVQVLPSDV
ncbi:uncharacterized protein H6S33_011987 [Morchella sextelata]|nr:uncharacterized protein H6S33_011987 [Morchella sextelata]KAH0610460.1 hypothetical protein H6S33_011987 [Morchella sextelata]